MSNCIFSTCKLAYNVQQAFSFYPSGITIGFEQDTYTIQEATSVLEVCAEILQGSIQRSTGVTFMFGVQFGSAGVVQNL